MTPHPYYQDETDPIKAALPEAREIELPLAPGSRLTVWSPEKFTGFGPDPFRLGQGYTIHLNGELWRAVLQTVSSRKGGTLIDLEIEGRYPEERRETG